MAIYDCFLYNGEAELLDIRLNVLDTTVDHFVIVESDRTFTGKPKALRFPQQQAAFERFLPRITYVVASQPYTDAWDNEHFARYQMLEGLKACQPDDVILICDLDEIPDPAQVLKYQHESGIKVFEMHEYYYYLNCRSDVTCISARMLNYSDVLLSGGPHLVRQLSLYLKFVPNGGHHWSYLMTPEQIRKKIESFAHTEFDDERFKNETNIADAMEAGRDLYGRAIAFTTVPIDDSFPAYVRDHQARLQHLIKAI
jgi:beta-1,4-mannosyl-glycoprotein beta-1,4-N-acetylglucosaminyltransferase